MDQLLSMFDRQPSLKPRDIIVMVADINAYSPAIQAVFGNAPGERFIPYSISDRTADQESPILHSFMQVVNTSIRYALPQSYSSFWKRPPYLLGSVLVLRSLCKLNSG